MLQIPFVGEDSPVNEYDLLNDVNKNMEIVQYDAVSSRNMGAIGEKRNPQDVSKLQQDAKKLRWIL